MLTRPIRSSFLSYTLSNYISLSLSQALRSCRPLRHLPDYALTISRCTAALDALYTSAHRPCGARSWTGRRCLMSAAYCNAAVAAREANIVSAGAAVNDAAAHSSSSTSASSSASDDDGSLLGRQNDDDPDSEGSFTRPSTANAGNTNQTNPTNTPMPSSSHISSRWSHRILHTCACGRSRVPLIEQWDDGDDCLLVEDHNDGHDESSDSADACDSGDFKSGGFRRRDHVALRRSVATVDTLMRHAVCCQRSLVWRPNTVHSSSLSVSASSSTLDSSSSSSATTPASSSALLSSSASSAAAASSELSVAQSRAAEAQMDLLWKSGFRCVF